MWKEKLKSYKKKYYLNSLIKGSISAAAIVLTAFYFMSIIEYLGQFDPVPRAVLFYGFLALVAASFYYWILLPLIAYFDSKRQISDIDAARSVGSFFPQVKDKLVNIIQLEKLGGSSDLVSASMAQRQQALEGVDFGQAIDLGKNREYLRWLFIPLVLIIATLFISPNLFKESTERLVYYNRKFVPQAPFDFKLLNEDMQVFRNEDFELKLLLEGEAIPQQVNLVTQDGRKLKMNNQAPGEFKYTFKNVQRGSIFHFEASGFESADYQLEVFTRPSLMGFSVFLDYPEYVGKTDERIENTGNLIVPQGTDIRWEFNTLETNDLEILFSKEDSSKEAATERDDIFEFNKKALVSDTYQLLLENKYSTNKDVIEYYLNVIPDEYPTISLIQYEDTMMFEFLALGGNIADDYGITDLNLRYRIIPKNGNPTGKGYNTIDLNFNRNAINQSYFYQLELSEFNLQEGQTLEYFIEVWDNDAVNGRKSSRSGKNVFRLPTLEEFREELKKESGKTEGQMNDALEKSKQLNEELKELQDRLKGKRKLDWQDKQNIQKLIEENKKLQDEVKKLQEMNQQFNQKNEKFNTQNPEIAEKAKQLQKLMDELLDEETKKLYEELQELLEQNFVNDELQEKLQDIDMKEENLQKELERALELFKKLKFDSKAEEIAQDLEKLAEEQKELAEQTEESKKSEMEEIKKEQEELNEKFENVKENFEELKELNEELNNRKDLESFEEQEQNIEDFKEQVGEQLEKQNKKKASEGQKQMSKEMQKMAEKMQQMQQSMEMQQLNENYDDLRKILENLITLSFDQESLMLDFQRVKRIDPKFIELSQQQLKLKDDAKVIEDSLISLSKRVFQIESFVTREVTAMNKYMEESLDAIRKRTPEIAASKQQFTMTSVNNLALLLNDILKQMQQQMSASMSGQQMSEKQSGSPSMSELQKQLNQKIENLKKSGKSGRELSEELAKLAAEQERIRNAMKQSMGQGGNPNGQQGKEGGEEEGMQEGEGSEGGENGNGQGDQGMAELLEEMEKTEEDLVNKRLTNELLERQKDILTRLLESENAERERDMEKEREAKTADQNLRKDSPENFSEYLKIKEMQIELLKTIPTSLNQYYKKQVNEYFKKIKN